MKINPKYLADALKNLMSEVKETASGTGGHVVQNLRTMLNQVSKEYVQKVKEKDSIAPLKQFISTEDGMVYAIALCMLCNSVITQYGPEVGQEVMQLSAKQPTLPSQLNPNVVDQQVRKESKNMKQHRLLNEKAMDLQFLPSDVISWLYDKNDNQVNTAKDIGVACHEAGNPVVSGHALSADINILVLKTKVDKGRFHIYPDGARSFWASGTAYPEMLDGHEDVERLVEIDPNAEEIDVAQSEMDAEDYAMPQELHPEEDELIQVGVEEGPNGMMKISGLNFNDLI